MVYLCVCACVCVGPTVVTHWQLGSDLHLSLSLFLCLSDSFFPVSAAQSSLRCTEWPLFSVCWRHPEREGGRERGGGGVQSDAHKLSFSHSLSGNAKGILPRFDPGENVWNGRGGGCLRAQPWARAHVRRMRAAKVPVDDCLLIQRLLRRVLWNGVSLPEFHCGEISRLVLRRAIEYQPWLQCYQHNFAQPFLTPPAAASD